MARAFKVVVFTPVWGRHDILHKWKDGVNRIMNYWPEAIEIIPFCIVSNEEDKAVVQSYGFNYVEAENKPLGRKHNEGLKALKGLDFDYIMQLGSDDVISNEYLEYAAHAMNKGLDLFGVNKIYFAEPITRKACSFSLTTHANLLIGAGRFISHRVIEMLNYELWPNDINKGLDKTSQDKLAEIGVFPCVITTSDICVLDIKSETNIWSYSIFGDNYPSVNYDEIKAKFPEL